MAQGSSSRNGRKVTLVVVHTAEGARDVDSLDAYFSRTKTGSSHAGADNNRLVEGWVPYDRASWTLRSGNPISDNIELCGFAKTSRGEWLSKYDGMLTNCARWIASRCKARGVPCIKLTPAQVRAGQSGVIGHIDWTEGMRDGSHWDPGPGFPWDVVMSRAQSILGGNAVAAPATTSEDFLVALSQQDQEETRNNVRDIAAALTRVQDMLRLHAPNGDAYPFNGLDGINNNVVGLYALIKAQQVTGGGQVDVDALAKELSKTLGADLATELGKKLAS